MNEEWDASNPEFHALFILEDDASVARIWGVKYCTIIAIIYDLGVTAGHVRRIRKIVRRTCHETNSCRLDTTHHHHAAAADTVVDIVVAEVGTADSNGHTMAGHTQVGCRLPALEHYKPQPCARTLHGTYPSDITAYTSSALSPLGVSLSYPSYHTNPA
ncbi:hypothetical protein Tco_0698938 [Tanacetum coccineum]